VASFLLERVNSAKKQSQYRYFPKNHIMTKREEQLFTILNENFGNRCYIIPQVHLSALLNHKVKGQNWRGAFSHINGKSVDFVLLRRKDLSVVCAIELDDTTHSMEARAKRDVEVERIFRDAKISLVRLRTIKVGQDTIEQLSEIIDTNE